MLWNLASNVAVCDEEYSTVPQSEIPIGSLNLKNSSSVQLKAALRYGLMNKNDLFEVIFSLF